ncbi:hypothetical protein BH23CHL7_BH23CHL7_04460 [soil metagenome]
MRYADSLLIEGEEVALRTRQHWLALVVTARYGFLLWLIAIGLLILGLALRPNVDFFADGTPAANIIGLAAIACFLVGLLIVLIRLWQWWAQDFMITNRRLMKVWGVLNKRSVDSSLEKINDARLDQSVFGRMFNYGHLDILTAGPETDLDDFDMIRDPKGFKRMMLTQKHSLEMGYYRDVPAPPMRAAMDMNGDPADPALAPPHADTAAAYMPPPADTPQAPATAAPADDAPAEAPPVEAPPADRSLEVTQTLARLADLRDRGAITDEEFEAKKRELLDRL